MFCCDGFRNAVSLAGERGLAILACEQSSGNTGFVLQSRGVAFEDEAKLKPAAVDVQINIDAVTGLRFCPFCGRKLTALVQESPDFFKGLATEHKRFLVSMPGL